MSGNDRFVDADDQNVLVTSAEVTTIGGPAAGDAGDPIATGGDAVAASLGPNGDVLNLAFLTAAGSAQILQVKVAELARARKAPDGREAAVGPDEEHGATSRDTETPSGGGGDNDGAIIAGDLTTVSGEAIAAGGGAATSVSGISVAVDLNARGQLSLTFVDADGDLQLVEANVAELLHACGLLEHTGGADHSGR